jgi:hypothetical protein
MSEIRQDNYGLIYDFKKFHPGVPKERGLLLE